MESKEKCYLMWNVDPPPSNWRGPLPQNCLLFSQISLAQTVSLTYRATSLFLTLFLKQKSSFYRLKTKVCSNEMIGVSVENSETCLMADKDRSQRRKHRVGHQLRSSEDWCEHFKKIAFSQLLINCTHLYQQFSISSTSIITF